MDPCFKYWTVRILNFIISIINLCTQVTFGWTFSYGLNGDRKKSETDYAASAHLVDILLYGHYSFFENARLNDNFFWKHNDYLHPKVIKDNDHITLYGFSESHAFFCVSDPNVDIFDTDVFPFPTIGEKTSAKQLIIMKLEHFHKFAEEEIGDPRMKVGCINHSSRCGSTLMCQVLQKVPKTRVLVEPFSLLNVGQHYYDHNWTTAETKRCLANCVRVLFKPVLGKEIDFMLLKYTCCANMLIPMLIESFPDFKWIFMTRSVKPAVKSFVKFQDSQPWFYLAADLFIGRFFWKHSSIDRTDKNWVKINDEVVRNGRRKYSTAVRMATIQASFFVPYEKVRHAHEVCIFYDDLIENPRENVEKVFRAFDVDLKHVDSGLTAFKFDSQGGVTGGIGTGALTVSQQEFVEIDKIYKRLGLPINSQMTLQEMKKIFY